MRQLSVSAALFLLACGGAAEAPAPPPEPVAEAPVPVAEEWKILSPSPLELEAEVRAAGIATSMADLVPTGVPDATYGTDKDDAAVYTGVVFAYALLGGRTSDKEVFLGQVRAMRDGLKVISAGDALIRTMDKSLEAIENDTAAREDFLKELDAQVQSSDLSTGWGPEDTTGPLLQAGAWLAGMNVTAKAVIRADDAKAADTLLKRSDVAAWFQQYVQSKEGSKKAGPTAKAVAGALGELKAIGERETVGIEGAKEIEAITGKLLKLL